MAYQQTQPPTTRTTYDLDPSHSLAHFSVKHLMIATVRGSMAIKSVEVRHDPARPLDTRIVGEIDAASIFTGDEKRDAHLRSPDFLDAEAHPTLRFESTHIERITDDAWRVRGDLTIRDVTRSVVLEVAHEGEAKDPWGRVHHAFVATTTIDRTAWGLTWNAALETGGVLVGDKVKVELNVQLVPRT